MYPLAFDLSSNLGRLLEQKDEMIFIFENKTEFSELAIDYDDYKGNQNHIHALVFMNSKESLKHLSLERFF